MRRFLLSLLLFGNALCSSLAVDSIVVFNEINYHPATNESTREWVEIHNQMSIDIDLSAWSIKGDISYTFTEGTIIPGNGYLVVAISPSALQADTGVLNVVGPFAGRLLDSAGTLELRDRNDRLMDALQYRDNGKWPLAPDGSGVTLAKRNPNTTSGSPEYWTSSVRVGGTPGTANFPSLAVPKRRSLISFDALWRFEASGNDLGNGWRGPGFDDSGWQGQNNAALVSYWPFNGDAAATRGTSGSLIGGVVAATDRNGTAGGALAFSGASSQYVSVAGGGGLNAAPAGTISLWVKWSGTQDADCCGTFGAVLARQANGQFSDDILALNNADPAVAHLVWRQSGGPAPVLVTSSAIVGTTWHHIAVTFSSSGSTLYMDGAPQGSAVGSGMGNNSSTPLSIGAWAGDGGGFCTASIDDVAIWDQPLLPGQIAQLAAQTKSPLDFTARENAVYFAGDGKVINFDDLRKTSLPLGPVTYYFRKAFQYSGDISHTTMNLGLAVDDGAVFYLNGTEVYRQNMPAGTISYGTLASSIVGDAPLLSDLSLPTASLLQGTNILAVEVHQTGAADSGMVFGASLDVTETSVPAFEIRPLITRHDVWKAEGTGTDLGTGWRNLIYHDTEWISGAALFFAGAGEVDGVPPDRITNITASASSEYTADGRLAVNAVNGAGLIGNAHGITPVNAMWMTWGTLVAPNDLDPSITFDLGSVSPIRSMKVWNYNEGLPGRPELLARGTASGDILAGTATNLLNMVIPNQQFNQAPGTQTDFSQEVDLGSIQGRYVKLDKLTNFPGGDFRFVGLSEVQFCRDPALKRTELPLGPVTHYFRKTFNFGGDPSHAKLVLNAAVDDGAVFYLNGVEIHRVNMATGTVTHSTLATASLAHATYSGAIAVSAASLLQGSNIFAVEVHQALVSGDPDMILGVELTAEISAADAQEFEPGSLVFNEITAGGVAPFQIELMNRGSQPIDLAGYVIQRTGVSPTIEHGLYSQVLAPGGFLGLNETALGFTAVAGDRLLLFLPGKKAVADSVEIHQRPQGRSPDGQGEWLTTSGLTFGAANSFLIHNEVVINEIMYHAPPTLEVPAVIGTNVVITLTNLWRYEQSGTDLGTNWIANGYDDSTWPSGASLLYNTASTLPVAKNTALALGPTTYYFRSSFVYTGTPAILALSLRHIVDDGVVLYLNGREIARFNVPAGPIGYTNNAVSTVTTALLRTIPGTVGLTNLILGTNILAAEVHQAVNSGNDVVFGAELTATIEAKPRVPYSDSPEEWVELFNRGSNAVNLTGWRLDEAVDYRFPTNTTIVPGGYLVAAKDPAALLAKFPGIQVVGPYANNLPNRGTRVVLKDASDNPAGSVFYYDDGRWPEAADGGGASLELRDPRADNTAGEAWAASNEGARSSWRTYSYRGTNSGSPVGPDGQWHEFVIGLLATGEVLIDDIKVIETPSTTPTNLIQNSTFDSGIGHWRIIGNHHGEVIDDPDQPGNKVLRLVANGSTDHMSNHGETTFAGNRDVVNGREYQITFRAKWISGSRQLNTRLYFNRLARVTVLDAPVQHGTPGSQNSRFVPNIGPTYAGFSHSPAVPAAFAPVTVSVRAQDPDGVASMRLWSRVDGSDWTSSAMTLSNDGFYRSMIAGKAAGTVIQFYVEGADALGAISTFPAAGTNSRALFKVDDGLAATNGLHNVRLVTLTADANELLRTINLMSNERIGCTLIYDEEEIFYDVGLRLKGSEHSRTTTPRLGFNVGFTSEQLLRGVHHSVAIDRSESVGFGQREMLVHQMLNHAGGVPTKYHDLIQVLAPRAEYTGSAELQLARYSNVFLDDQFENGSSGMVFEYELVYQLNPPTDDGTPEGNKVPAPDSVVGTTIRNLGDDKENYRWSFLIKNNEDRDDYSGIIAFCKAMELTGASFNNQITNYIDPDQWLRGVAVNVLSGCGDSYGGDGSQHNVQFYVPPGAQRVLYFPHDMDAFFDANRSIVPNNDVAKLISVPAHARTYYSHLQDVLATTYNAAYMTRWANHFGQLLPAQNFASHLAFIVQRASVVNNAINAAVPTVAFAITSNSGNDFGTSTNTLSISGSAPLSVKTIQVNGVAYPLNWISTTTWSLSIPLFGGPNPLFFQGLDHRGVRLTNAVDTITITNTGLAASLPVVINEWMADNAGPMGFADPLDGFYQDWFELFNPNTNGVNLAGFYLTDNLGQPTKWQIPSGTVIAPRGFLLVWADNETNQNGLSPKGDLHAPFQLSAGGESIGLFSPGGVAQHTISFTQQVQAVSQGLFPDGDTNTFYFMANWTPRAANTLAGPLRFSGLSFQNGSVHLTWGTIPGRTYRVLYKDELANSSWLPLGGNVPALGATATASDSLPAGAHRFYRIERVE
ncbi:MAG: hypothetical protein JWM16_4603 [Verrucomicrobiales bacterium]|nr:hypothetical protein [Verrucomicrobiales bacterium]